MSTPCPQITNSEHEYRQIPWRADYLWKIHSSISENIRFADTKAGFTAAVAGAVLGALFTLNQSPGRGLRAPWAWSQWCCILAYVLLTLSAVSGSWCVHPRLRGGPGRGFIFWRNIAQYASHADFARDFALHSQDDLDKQLAESIHDLSRICAEKYRFLKIAVVSGISGGLVGAIALLKMSFE